MKINDIYEPENINYGYVAVKPDFKSANILVNLLKTAGITSGISASDLHSTLMYSKDKSISDDVKTTIQEPLAIYDDIDFKSIEILGNAIVIKFQSKKLEDRFKELSQYLKHSFDDILLHLSVKYYNEEQESEMKQDLDTIKKYKKEIKEIFSGIYFTSEYFEELND